MHPLLLSSLILFIVAPAYAEIATTATSSYAGLEACVSQHRATFIENNRKYHADCGPCEEEEETNKDDKNDNDDDDFVMSRHSLECWNNCNMCRNNSDKDDNIGGSTGNNCYTYSHNGNGYFINNKQQQK